MEKLIIAVLLSSVLAGCACDPEIVTEIKKIYVPVAAQCPIPKDIIKPNLPINELTSEDAEKYEKITKAYAASLSICMSYAEQEEEVLNSYRKETTNGSKEENTDTTNNAR